MSQVVRGVVTIDGVPALRERVDGDTFIETLPGGVRHPIIVAHDDAPFENTQIFTVPPDHYFMMGDNRDDSLDSRDPAMGFVPAQNLWAAASFLTYSTADAAPWWRFSAWRWDRLARALALAMRWSDEALVLSVRRHGESSLLVHLLTRERGRHAGLVRGGQRPKARAVWQIGNRVLASWSARLAEHLGTLTGELAHGYAASVIAAPVRLAGLASRPPWPMRPCPSARRTANPTKGS